MAFWRGTGFALVRGQLDVPAERWRAAADAAYARVASPGSADGQSAGARYRPTASSLSLSAAGLVDEALAVLRPVQPLVKSMLGCNAVACDVDEAWLRRQYAPANYPPRHAPHGWHQDGALRFDFLGTPDPPADALLPLVTCWLPLIACGRSAPGLELAGERCQRLLPLSELSQVDHRPGMRIAPEMQPGDVLVILAGTLHATHVRPEMTVDQTSIELRFFDGERLPTRVAGDRFVGWRG